MAQGILPFKYEAEKSTTGMTALAGLPVYLDLARITGLSKSIERQMCFSLDTEDEITLHSILKKGLLFKIKSNNQKN